MREMTRSLAEMSDSREMLEANTPPAITIFIAMLFIILASALAWSFIGEIDEVARASGVVRPNKKVSIIQASSLGQVEYIHAQEGMKVKSGELLIRFDQKEYKMQLKNRGSEIEKLNQELGLLQRYEKSVQSFQNLFSETKEKEVYYYDLVKQFLLEYNKLKLDYQTSMYQIDIAMNEVVQSQENTATNIRVTEQKWKQEKSDLERKIDLLESELDNEKKLKASLQGNKNMLPPADKQRTERFNTYHIKFQQLTNTADERKSVYERSLALGDRFVPKVQIEEELAQYETALLQISQFKSEALLNVETNIVDYERQLREFNVNLFKLVEKSGQASAERESLQIEMRQLSEKQQELIRQEEMIDQSETNALEKFRLDRVVQINTTIEEKTKKLDTLTEAVEQLRAALEKNTLKAPISGTVNVLKEINTGAVVQPGEPLLGIIPSNESKYKMSIAVPNDEIGKIALGDKVDLNFHAFPKQSFGSLQGTITSISTDSILQEDGRSYYLVEASLANKPLTNRKGERGEIRVGMTAEAYVITDSKKIIQYLLEKINLRE